MTEQQKQELISGFGFVDFDNNEKAEPPPPIDWQPMKDWKFSEGSREVFRMCQERKNKKPCNGITKQEFKNFVQSDWMNYIDQHFDKLKL